LIGSSGGQLSAVVKPLIESGGRIVLDLTSLDYLDSSGLGTLVGLKVSALNKGYCTLELVNLTPRVQQLLSMTNLLQMFSKQT
jgi:anti-anti-sigma factor